MELHLEMNRKEARDKAIYLLRMVGIPDAGRRVYDYPHQFSGGMRQRVMIAIALACNPKIIIADEPTTALDVTTQAQLLELMTDMVDEFKASLVLVTHNLGVVARYVERIYVMYAGRIVEAGTSEEIFGNPRHPYTVALLQCVPMLDEEDDRKLVPIVGAPPNLIDLPDQCAFYPRCKHRIKACRDEPWPGLRHLDGQHYVSCRADI
jgi:peptide/nickel transport system ATP-binding protein